MLKNNQLITVDENAIQYLRHYVYFFLKNNTQIKVLDTLIRDVEVSGVVVEKPIVRIEDVKFGRI